MLLDFSNPVGLKCEQPPDYKRGIRMDLENGAGRNFTS